MISLMLYGEDKGTLGCKDLISFLINFMIINFVE